MKIIAVSMVRDEQDIIEPFLRHTLAVADHHLIFDHHSTDRTRWILHCLQREGLPITVVTDDIAEYRQAVRTTALLKKALLEHQADWLLPLDVDEFLQADSLEHFRDLLQNSSSSVTQLPLVNYGPHPEDDRVQINPVLRLQHRLHDVPTGKVILPASIVQEPSFAISTGNHEVSLHGQVVPQQLVKSPWLAHFPIRSGIQAALKVVQHEWQYQSGGYGGGGTHYSGHLARLWHDPQQFLQNPQRYLAGESHAPASYWGSPLAYTEPVNDQTLLQGMIGMLQAGAKQQQSKPGPPSQWKFWQRRRLLSIAEQARELTFAEVKDAPESTHPAWLRGELELLTHHWQQNQFQARIRVRNTGSCVWRTTPGFGQVNLGVQVWDERGQVLVQDFLRIPLPSNLAPGEHTEVLVQCPQPEISGAILGIDLVAEGIVWFGLRTVQVVWVNSLG